MNSRQEGGQMFVLYDSNKQRLPIRVYLKQPEDLAPDCYKQYLNLSNLPFAFHHITAMPDTHVGYGMPIGGVLATNPGYIIPNAVGVDIGCGMCFIPTNIPAEILNAATPSSPLIKFIIENIMRNIPTGFSRHKDKQPSRALDTCRERYSDLEYAPALIEEISAGYYQLGTLGGGNHFIELQADENGLLCIMLHSGSRNFGKKICDYFNYQAKELNALWFSVVDPNWDLSFLSVDVPAGQSYIAWMNLALDFAQENRNLMMERIKNIVFNMVRKYTDFKNIKLGEQVNAHHNYAAMEHHFGQNVWVHRKGAIRLRPGDTGIVPGAMGSYSYIVKATNNPPPGAFYSCSHGAGRAIGRKKALAEYSKEEVLNDLASAGVVIGKNNLDDVAEECRYAYKDIDEVLENEKELAIPVKKLRTIAVIKG
jgi:tRNA-splicing ligase RtcB